MEDIGFIRRTIQDVLVPEMQGLKERMAAHDEKFVSIDRRFDQVEARLERIEKRLDVIEARLDRVVTALERIEARLSFSELDRRLVRLEILQERGLSGPKSSAA